MTKPLPEIRRVAGLRKPKVVYDLLSIYCQVSTRYTRGGACISGPRRLTERGAINAWNRMVERMREGE